MNSATKTDPVSKFFKSMGQLFKKLGEKPEVLVKTQEKQLKRILEDVKKNTPGDGKLKNSNTVDLSQDKKEFVFKNTNPSAVGVHEDVRVKTNAINGTSGKGEGSKFIVRAVNDAIIKDKAMFVKAWAKENDRMFAKMTEAKNVKDVVRQQPKDPLFVTDSQKPRTSEKLT